MEGPAKELCMGQDLDYNTVIIYFTADDLIRFSPPPILREWRKRGSVCVCVCVCVCVDMGVDSSVPRPHLPLSLCGSEKSWLLMGEVIKSGVVATFPLQGEVQSQLRGVEGRRW